mgnify:FL=1
MDGSIISLILDLMVILITVGFIWYGVRPGFLVMLVNTCRRLLSCIVAYIASRALATTIYNVYTHDRLVESISESISGTLSESEASVQVSVILQELPGFLRNMVYGLFGDAATINETVGNALDGSVTAITSTIVDEIVYPIVYLVLQCLLFLLLFACLKIIISALSETLRNLRRCILTGVPDMLAGAALGAVEGVLTVFVVVVIIQLLIYCSGGQIPFLGDDEIQSTHLFRVFYNLSPFVDN